MTEKGPLTYGSIARAEKRHGKASLRKALEPVKAEIPSQGQLQARRDFRPENNVIGEELV